MTPPATTVLSAVAPPSGKVAPPGDYYLVINKKTLQSSVPSVARIVRVGVGTDLTDAIQPYADDNPAAPTGGSATPDEDSSRSTAAVKQAPVLSRPAAGGRRRRLGRGVDRQALVQEVAVEAATHSH